MKIKNNTKRLLCLCNGVTLMPGVATELGPEQFEQVRNDETFQSWQKLAMIKVVGAPALLSPAAVPVEDEVYALAGMKVGDKRKAIAAEIDKGTLLSWQGKENRQGIKKAIEDRLIALDQAERAALDGPAE